MKNKIKKYYIFVLGCQMNYSDAERIEAILAGLGYQKTDQEKSADLIVLVACSVRQSAVDRIFGKAREWEKKRQSGSPRFGEAGKLMTILTGCVLPGDQKKLANKFDLILPIKEIGKLPQKLSRVETRRRLVSTNFKFQATVPIMTGCNNFCAYCVVPYVRGREVSRPAEEIIRECKKIIKNGCKEIFLLGQNVNSYNPKPIIHNSKFKTSGKKIRPANFAELLEKIDNIKGDYWLRFATSHPKDLSLDLLKVMKDGQHITPYLHLPIQAGDNKILKAMNRKYTVAHYLNLIAQARKLIPEIMISTDVIVGFPGETGRQFENTKKLFRKAEFDMAYIAEYSPRLGTAAFALKDNVAKAEKKKRKEELNEILKKTALKNNQKMKGKVVEVLVENFKNGRCVGKSANYKTVSFVGNKNLIGQFVKVKIKTPGSWGLGGEMLTKYL